MGGALTARSSHASLIPQVLTKFFTQKRGGSIPFKSASEFIVLSFIERSYCTTIQILDKIYRYIPSGNLYSLVTSSR